MTEVTPIGRDGRDSGVTWAHRPRRYVLRVERAPDGCSRARRGVSTRRRVESRAAIGRGIVTALSLGLLVATTGCDAATTPPTPTTADAAPDALRPLRPQAPPLAGVVIALDPGHQLGNGRFPAEISRSVAAGGFSKACNTTGTATDAGYPEATLVWSIAGMVRSRLERLGARVVLSRSSNSASQWGPCVDERGRLGNPGEAGPTADLKLSIHADGSYAAGARGFHVIAPDSRAGWTDDIARPSLRLAREVRAALLAAGVETSTYRGSDGIDVRGDLGTLNLSDVPTVMVELGNMRDAGDAALMTSRSGRRGYAEALVAAVLRYLR